MQNSQVGYNAQLLYYTGSTWKDIPVKKIHASRGKITRAEPVSSLYERNRVHHVGFFAELEDQLCEWVPGNKSPDRLDALVHGLTELMLQEQETEQLVVYDPASEVESSLDIGAF